MLAQFNISQIDLNKIALKSFHKFKLSPTTKLVLIALVDCYNPHQTFILFKQEDIAKQLGISLRSVQRATKELAEHDLIVYKTKKYNQYKFTNVFFKHLGLTITNRKPKKSYEKDCIQCNP